MLYKSVVYLCLQMHCVDTRTEWLLWACRRTVCLWSPVPGTWTFVSGFKARKPSIVKSRLSKMYKVIYNECLCTWVDIWVINNVSGLCSFERLFESNQNDVLKNIGKPIACFNDNGLNKYFIIICHAFHPLYYL